MSAHLPLKLPFALNYFVLGWFNGKFIRSAMTLTNYLYLRCVSCNERFPLAHATIVIRSSWQQPKPVKDQVHCSHFITIKIHFNCNTIHYTLQSSFTVHCDSVWVISAIRWRVIRLFICSLCSFHWENIVMAFLFILFSFFAVSALSPFVLRRYSVCIHFWSRCFAQVCFLLLLIFWSRAHTT